MLVQCRNWTNLKTSSHPVVLDAVTELRQIGEAHTGEGPAKGFAAAVHRAALPIMAELFSLQPTCTTMVKSAVDGKMYSQPYLVDQPGFVSIKRAGDGFVPAAQLLLPQAGFGSVTLARDHDTHQPREIARDFSPQLALPDRETIYVLDLMLATGGSNEYALTLLKKAGARNIHFIGLVAAPAGVQFITEKHPDVQMTIAVLDERLNNDAYIIPGFGDAGDLLFGTKKWQEAQRG